MVHAFQKWKQNGFLGEWGPLRIPSISTVDIPIHTYFLKADDAYYPQTPSDDKDTRSSNVPAFLLLALRYDAPQEKIQQGTFWVTLSCLKQYQCMQLNWWRRKLPSPWLEDHHDARNWCCKSHSIIEWLWDTTDTREWHQREHLRSLREHVGVHPHPLDVLNAICFNIFVSKNISFFITLCFRKQSNTIGAAWCPQTTM